MKTSSFLEEYDSSLFDIFKNEFSKKYKNRFKNENSYNSTEKKCNFIIHFLKILSNNSKINCVENAINTLIEFLIDKEKGKNNINFSSFNDKLLSQYKKELLSFRNTIATLFIKLILKYEDEENYDENDDPIMPIVNEAMEDYISGKYNFLKNFFELVKYCLNEEYDIYKDFLLILNKNDIIKALTENKNFSLNIKQKDFILNNKFSLTDSSLILEKLKIITISNDEILKYINDNEDVKFKKKKIRLKKKGNKNKIILKDYINIQKKEKIAKQNLIFEEENLEKNKNDICPLKDIEYNINQSNKKEIKTNMQNLKNENLVNKKYLKNLEKRVESKNQQIKIYLEENQKNSEELLKDISKNENKLDKIYFQYIIKDIINYSYEFFNKSQIDYLTIKEKINFIQKKLDSKEYKIFDDEEKIAFCKFLDNSFLLFDREKYFNINEVVKFYENEISNEKMDKSFSRKKEIISKIEKIKPVLNKIDYKYSN